MRLERRGSWAGNGALCSLPPTPQVTCNPPVRKIPVLLSPDVSSSASNAGGHEALAQKTVCPSWLPAQSAVLWPQWERGRVREGCLGAVAALRGAGEALDGCVHR